MELVVGRIGRAHGLRGEVAVEVRTDVPDERFAPGSVLDCARPDGPGGLDTKAAGSRGTLTVEGARWHSGRLLVAFEGIEDRVAAAALRGTMLQVDVPEDADTADPDEYYDHQLADLAVVTTTGRHLGTVTEVVHLPMQEVLAVHTEFAGEVLVPFVAEIVPEVDLEGGRVVVDPPDGLFPEERP